MGCIKEAHPILFDLIVYTHNTFYTPRSSPRNHQRPTKLESTSSEEQPTQVKIYPFSTSNSERVYAIDRNYVLPNEFSNIYIVTCGLF